MEKILSPSILSANFANLEKDFNELKKNNIQSIHIDVMDGNYVPNITFGPMQIKCMREISDFYFDCHLMVNEPIRFIDDFVKSGCDCLTVHVEACTHIHRTLEYIKSKNIHCGVSLNPGTSIRDIENILYLVDKVLVMSVNPGFGGQKFIDNSIEKIESLREMMYKKNMKDKIIQVDGGINEDTIKKVYEAGARDIVVGSFIFDKGSIGDNIKKLLDKIR